MHMAELFRPPSSPRIINRSDNLLTDTFTENEWDTLLPHISMV